MQRPTVALDDEGVVAATLADGLGRGAIAVQGVGRDGRSREIQKGDDVACRCDFAALRSLAHTKHEPLLGRPGGHEMQGLRSSGRVDRAAQGFAIERYDLPRGADLPRQSCREALHEAAEDRLEPLRIEQPEQSAERIVAGRTVFESQDSAEEIRFGGAEIGHVDASLGPAQHGCKGDEQDLRQVVPRIPGPRIRNSREKQPKSTHLRSPRNQEISKNPFCPRSEASFAKCDSPAQ